MRSLQVAAAPAFRRSARVLRFLIPGTHVPTQLVMMKPRPRSLALLAAAAAFAACARHRGDAVPVTVLEVPLFETRSEISTGTGLHSDYHIADFDGDGGLDMAVCSVTGELRVMIGNGATFVAGQEQQMGGLPIWMAGADFDNDGDQDIACVRSAANSTDVWLNDGAGTFTPGAALPVGTDALAVTVGDFDDDGNADLAVSRPSAPEIVVGFGDGAGNFGVVQQVALPGGGRAFNLAAGDANRDGIDDLIVADPDLSRVVILLGAPGGNGIGADHIDLAVPGVPGAVAIGDLSGDGVDDLVVSAFDADRYVVITEIFGQGPAFGDGGGGGVAGYAWFDVPVPARPSVATIADVTGDGLPDLVACLAFNATMCIAPQLPGGGVGELTLLDSSGLPLRPFVGDFDGNGRNDLFALSGGGERVNLWFARPEGALAGARSYSSGLPQASWLEGGDFDQDGDFEVVTGSIAGGTVSILGKGADGGLQVEATVDVGAAVHQLEAGDLDADGRTDLVVGVPGGVKVLANRSSPGAYAFDVVPGSPVTIGSSDYPFGIAMGDFDRDADMDLAICDFTGGGLHLVWGTGTPFAFGPETVLAIGGGPVDVVAADFTGDGRQDLALSRALASDLVVLRNEDGVFAPFLTLPVGQTPNYLITNDFNRDGRADLVVSNAGSGTITVLFGSGTGFSGQDFAAGTAPTALLARDLTNDNVPDILVASLVSGDFRVLIGDGTGGFPLLPTFPGTLGASDAVLQDMSGDGRPELLITSLITNRVSMVRNISTPAPTL